jgi:hypothetical protein
MLKFVNLINANKVKFISASMLLVLTDQILLQFFRKSSIIENIVVSITSSVFGGIIYFIFKLWILFTRKYDFFFIKTPMLGKFISYYMIIILTTVFSILFFLMWFSDEPLYGFCYIIAWLVLLSAQYYG